MESKITYDEFGRQHTQPIEALEPRLLLSASPSDLPELGMGLGGVSYFSTAFVFADALKLENRGWKYVNPGGTVPLADLDANGDVTNLGTLGRSVQARPFQNNGVDVEPKGRYVLEWEGNGDVSLDTGPSGVTLVSSSSNRKIYDVQDVPGSGLGVTITNGADAPNHVRNVHLWMPDTRDLNNNGSIVDDANARSVAPSDQAALPAAQRWTSAFHPGYLEHLDETAGAVGHFRYMDWLQTNNASSIEWSDRRLPTASFAQGRNYNRGGFDFSVPGTGGTTGIGEQTRGTGLAWEWVIEMSNETGRDAWINIPHAADDNYIRQVARLFRYGSNANGTPYTSPQFNPVHAPLDSNLKVYVEYSNEIWSNGTSFRQGDYASQQADALGLPGKQQFNGRRAAEVWDLFAQELGVEADRMIRVAGAWTAQSSYTRQYLDAALAHGDTLATNPEPDVLAVTTYFGSPLIEYYFNETDWRNGVDYDNLADPVINQSLDYLINDIVLGAGDAGGEEGAALGGFGDKNRLIAEDYGLPLVSYEGNSSMYTESKPVFMLNFGDLGNEVLVDNGTPGATRVFSINNYVADNYGPDQQITDSILAINRHPRFAEAYRAHLDTAKDLGLYTHDAFVDVSQWGKFGQWGHKEYQGQPSGYGPGEAVKWQAVLDWEAEQDDIREKGVGTAPIGTAPQWQSNDLEPVFAGDAYSRDITISGGNGSKQLTIKWGDLPPGLTASQINNTTIRITGTVAASAESKTYRFMAQALDANNDPDWQIFGIRVLDPAGETVILGPDADLYGSPTSNNTGTNGNGSLIYAGTGTRRGYFQFGSDEIVGDATSAILRLHIDRFQGGNDPDGDGNPATARVWIEAVSDDSFTDNTAFGDVPDSTTRLTADQFITAGVEEFIEFDLTDYYAAEVAGDGIASFAVRAEVAGGANSFSGVGFSSKEDSAADQRPTLTVETQSSGGGGDPQQQAFGSGPVLVGGGAQGRVQIENFDLGGQDVAFSENDTQKNGSSNYRAGDAPYVDLNTSNTAPGATVGWFRAGEWLEYTVDIQQTGDYDLTIRGAKGSGGDSPFKLQLANGSTVTDLIDDTFINTGDWANFNLQTFGTATLSAGVQTLRLAKTVSNGLNIDWFELTPAAAAAVATNGTQGTGGSQGGTSQGTNNSSGFVAGAVTVQAEDHDNVTTGSGTHAWVPFNFAHDLGTSLWAGPDSGANYNTGYVSTSPRLDFTIDFPTAGTYWVHIRGAAQGSTAATSDSLHVGLDGQPIKTARRISNFDPNGGFSWSSSNMANQRVYIDVTSAGVHTLNVWMREDGFAFDALTLADSLDFAPV